MNIFRPALNSVQNIDTTNMGKLWTVLLISSNKIRVRRAMVTFNQVLLQVLKETSQRDKDYQLYVPQSIMASQPTELTPLPRQALLEHEQSTDYGFVLSVQDVLFISRPDDTVQKRKLRCTRQRVENKKQSARQTLNWSFIVIGKENTVSACVKCQEPWSSLEIGPWRLNRAHLEYSKTFPQIIFRTVDTTYLC